MPNDLGHSFTANRVKVVCPICQEIVFTSSSISNCDGQFQILRCTNCTNQLTFNSNAIERVDRMGGDYDPTKYKFVFASHMVNQSQKALVMTGKDECDAFLAAWSLAKLSSTLKLIFVYHSEHNLGPDHAFHWVKRGSLNEFYTKLRTYLDEKGSRHPSNVVSEVCNYLNTLGV